MKLLRWASVPVLMLTVGIARADRLIWIPTAAVSRPQLDYIAEPDGKLGIASAQFGLAKQFDVLARRYRNFGDRDRTEIGGEYVVLPEGLATPGVAVGIWDVSDEGPRGRRFFGVITKSMPAVDKLPLGFKEIKAHVGVGSNSLSGVFVGAQAGLPFGLGLYAEYDARKYNAGISWSPLAPLRLKAESWNGRLFVGAQLRSPL